MANQSAYLEQKEILFNELIKKIKKKNIVRSNFFLDDLRIKSKIEYMCKILSESPVVHINYMIRFWEDKENLESLIKIHCKTFEIKDYLKGKTPGVAYVDDKTINAEFLNDLITSHFNFELALDPSINMKLYVYLETVSVKKFFDIYDDRGFKLYYLG